MSEILGGNGHRVLATANGGTALAILEWQVAYIDLLLADVVLPQMSGLELTARVRTDFPSTKVLLMSEYDLLLTESEEPVLQVTRTQCPQIMKLPVDAQELIGIVDELLLNRGR